MNCQQLAAPTTVDTNDCLTYTYTSFLDDSTLAGSVDQHWGAECGDANNLYGMIGMTVETDMVTGLERMSSFKCCRIVLG